MPNQSYISCENNYAIGIFFDTFLSVRIDLQMFEHLINFLEQLLLWLFAREQRVSEYLRYFHCNIPRGKMFDETDLFKLL